MLTKKRCTDQRRRHLLILGRISGLSEDDIPLKPSSKVARSAFGTELKQQLTLWVNSHHLFQLRQFFSQQSAELQQISSIILNQGTKWIFNPPSSPHFGGKWEAGVKSMKYHLRRIIGDQLLTYEEFSTILCQIEGILNSRPLCPLTDDPNDLDVLTPGHFLVGHAINLIPEPSLQHLKISRLSRWQHLSFMTQSFWNKWSREYLQKYLTIYKWRQAFNPIKEGSIVLITDERYSPAKWPLGRVIKLHQGSDGVARVASVKTSTSTLTKPIVKLCPLNITSETCSSPESTKAGVNVQN